MSTLEMIVTIDCPGCQSKVKKALQKLDGVDSVDIDMSLQKVTVTGWAEQEQILETVRKTGRKADLWPYSYEISEYETSTQYTYDHYNYHRNPASDYFRSEQPLVETYDQHHGYYNNNIGSDFDYDRYGQNYYYDSDGDDDEYDRSNFYNYRRRLHESSNAMFSDENVNACSIM